MFARLRLIVAAFAVLPLDHHAAASSQYAPLMQETTRFEPGELDHKYYVRGIATVLEKTVKGGDEQLTLLTVKRPAIKAVGAGLDATAANHGGASRRS
jgi:hypothetical protein